MFCVQSRAFSRKSETGERSKGRITGPRPVERTRDGQTYSGPSDTRCFDIHGIWHVTTSLVHYSSVVLCCKSHKRSPPVISIRRTDGVGWTSRDRRRQFLRAVAIVCRPKHYRPHRPVHYGRKRVGMVKKRDWSSDVGMVLTREGGQRGLRTKESRRNMWDGRMQKPG